MPNDKSSHLFSRKKTQHFENQIVQIKGDFKTHTILSKCIKQKNTQ